MIYNLSLLLMGGGRILSIFPCQPLHAVGCPLDCPKIFCLIAFPNFNQTPKQNYPSQLENISRYPKKKQTKSISEYMPTYQSSLQCDFCMPNHLVTRPVTEFCSPGKAFFPREKCLGHIVCITIVFVHAFDVNFVPPSEISSTPWCPNLVTCLPVTVAL